MESWDRELSNDIWVDGVQTSSVPSIRRVSTTYCEVGDMVLWTLTQKIVNSREQMTSAPRRPIHCQKADTLSFQKGKGRRGPDVIYSLEFTIFCVRSDSSSISARSESIVLYSREFQYCISYVYTVRIQYTSTYSTYCTESQYICLYVLVQ